MEQNEPERHDLHTGNVNEWMKNPTLPDQVYRCTNPQCRMYFTNMIKPCAGCGQRSVRKIKLTAEQRAQHEALLARKFNPEMDN